MGLSVSTVLLSSTFRRTWPLFIIGLSVLPSIWMLLLKRWRMAGVYILMLFLSYIANIPAFDSFTIYLPWPILLFLTILQYVLPGITIGMLIMQTTGISEYLNGLNRLRVPAGFALATSVIFRFIPTIRHENAGIKRALRMRGLGGRKAFRHPLRFFNYRFVPLLLSTFRIADELSMASLCRGLSTARKRTSYESDNLHLFDWVVIILSGLLLIFWVITLAVATKK